MHCLICSLWDVPVFSSSWTLETWTEGEAEEERIERRIWRGLIIIWYSVFMLLVQTRPNTILSPPHSKYTTISTNNKTILFLLQSVHFLLTLSTVDLSHKKQNKVKPNCRGKTDSSIPGGCATPMRKGSHDSCPDQGHDKLDTIYFLLSFLLFCSFLPIRPFVLQGIYIILCIVTGRDDDGHITDNNIRSKQWQNAERCEDQENSVVSTTSDGESWKHNH